MVHCRNICERTKSHRHVKAGLYQHRGKQKTKRASTGFKTLKTKIEARRNVQQTMTWQKPMDLNELVKKTQVTLISLIQREWREKDKGRRCNMRQEEKRETLKIKLKIANSKLRLNRTSDSYKSSL